jgi:AcrR family transcriptional regulator
VSVATTVPSHRERKKLATRQAIHDAAFDLVDRHGLAGATVEAISERAGVAPRTFWSYFSSKEDAVIDRDPEWPNSLRTALLERPAGEDAVTSLRLVLEHYVGERLVDSKRAVRRQRLIRREPHLMAAVAASFDEIERALVSAVADRLGADPAIDLRPGVLVGAACGACRVAQQRWADDAARRPFPELVEEAFNQLAEGLAPLVDERRAR